MDKKIERQKKIIESKPAQYVTKFLIFTEYLSLIWFSIVFLILIAAAFVFAYYKRPLSISGWDTLLLALLIVLVGFTILLTVWLIRYLKKFKKKQEDKTVYDAKMKALIKDKYFNFFRYYNMSIGVFMLAFVIYLQFGNQQFGDSKYFFYGVVVVILLLIPSLIYNKKKGMSKKE